MSNSCGDCGLCCSLIPVDALSKPRGRWCQHFERGQGCTVYERRPGECRSFTCAYLTTDDLGEVWRPDRAGFLMWSDGDTRRLVIEVDPARPFSWQRDPYYAQIKAWSSRYVEGGPSMVVVRTAGRNIVILPEADMDLGPEQARGISSGYREIDGVTYAYAEYI